MTNRVFLTLLLLLLQAILVTVVVVVVVESLPAEKLLSFNKCGVDGTLQISSQVGTLVFVNLTEKCDIIIENSVVTQIYIGKVANHSSVTIRNITCTYREVLALDEIEIEEIRPNSRPSSSEKNFPSAKRQEEAYYCVFFSFQKNDHDGIVFESVVIDSVRGQVENRTTDSRTGFGGYGLIYFFNNVENLQSIPNFIVRQKVQVSNNFLSLELISKTLDDMCYRAIFFQLSDSKLEYHFLGEGLFVENNTFKVDMRFPTQLTQAPQGPETMFFYSDSRSPFYIETNMIFNNNQFSASMLPWNSSNSNIIVKSSVQVISMFISFMFKTFILGGKNINNNNSSSKVEFLHNTQQLTVILQESNQLYYKGLDFGEALQGSSGTTLTFKNFTSIVNITSRSNSFEDGTATELLCSCFDIAYDSRLIRSFQKLVFDQISLHIFFPEENNNNNNKNNNIETFKNLELAVLRLGVIEEISTSVLVENILLNFSSRPNQMYRVSAEENLIAVSIAHLRNITGGFFAKNIQLFANALASNYKQLTSLVAFQTKDDGKEEIIIIENCREISLDGGAIVVAHSVDIPDGEADWGIKFVSFAMMIPCIPTYTQNTVLPKVQILCSSSSSCLKKITVSNVIVDATVSNSGIVEMYSTGILIFSPNNVVSPSLSSSSKNVSISCNNNKITARTIKLSGNSEAFIFSHAPFYMAQTFPAISNKQELFEIKNIFVENNKIQLVDIELGENTQINRRPNIVSFVTLCPKNQLSVFGNLFVSQNSLVISHISSRISSSGSANNRQIYSMFVVYIHLLNAMFLTSSPSSFSSTSSLTYNNSHNANAQQMQVQILGEIVLTNNKLSLKLPPPSETMILTKPISFLHLFVANSFPLPSSSIENKIIMIKLEKNEFQLVQSNNLMNLSYFPFFPFVNISYLDRATYQYHNVEISLERNKFVLPSSSSSSTSQQNNNNNNNNDNDKILTARFASLKFVGSSSPYYETIPNLQQQQQQTSSSSSNLNLKLSCLKTDQDKLLLSNLEKDQVFLSYSNFSTEPFSCSSKSMSISKSMSMNTPSQTKIKTSMTIDPKLSDTKSVSSSRPTPSLFFHTISEPSHSSSNSEISQTNSKTESKKIIQRRSSIVTEPLAASAVAVMAVSALSGSPDTFESIQVALSIANLDDCVSNSQKSDTADERSVPQLTANSNPTTMEISFGSDDDPFSTYNGAIVGNFLLFIGVVFIGFILVVVTMLKTNFKVDNFIEKRRELIKKELKNKKQQKEKQEKERKKEKETKEKEKKEKRKKTKKKQQQKYASSSSSDTDNSTASENNLRQKMNEKTLKKLKLQQIPKRISFNEACAKFQQPGLLFIPLNLLSLATAPALGTLAVSTFPKISFLQDFIFFGVGGVCFVFIPLVFVYYATQVVAPKENLIENKVSSSSTSSSGGGVFERFFYYWFQQRKIWTPMLLSSEKDDNNNIHNDKKEGETKEQQQQQNALSSLPLLMFGRIFRKYHNPSFVFVKFLAGMIISSVGGGASTLCTTKSCCLICASTIFAVALLNFSIFLLCLPFPLLSRNNQFFNSLFVLISVLMSSLVFAGQFSSEKSPAATSKPIPILVIISIVCAILHKLSMFVFPIRMLLQRDKNLKQGKQKNKKNTKQNKKFEATVAIDMREEEEEEEMISAPSFSPIARKRKQNEEESETSLLYPQQQQQQQKQKQEESVKTNVNKNKNKNKKKQEEEEEEEQKKQKKKVEKLPPLENSGGSHSLSLANLQVFTEELDREWRNNNIKKEKKKQDQDVAAAAAAVSSSRNLYDDDELVVVPLPEHQQQENNNNEEEVEDDNENYYSFEVDSEADRELTRRLLG